MQNLIYVVVAVVLLGGGVWWYTNQDAVPKSTGDMPGMMMNEEGKSGGMSGTGTFATIMMMNHSMKCDFTASDESMTSEGVFYYDGDRFAVEAVTTMPEGQSQTNMITGEDAVYSWSTSAQGTYAFMMPRDEDDAETMSQEESRGMGDTQSFDTDQQVAYDCDMWQVDESVFTPPSDIEFMDMQAMMESASGAMQMQMGGQ